MPLATHSPTPRPPLTPRLVVADMDGTLLDGDGRIPDSFWPVLDAMRDGGVTFAVASGRQYPALARLFQRDAAGIAFIAENGAYVSRDGSEVSSRPLDRQVAERLVAEVRAMAQERNIGLVWCGRGTAYIERHDAAFVREVTTYYASLEVVDDLAGVDEPPLKLAAYVFDGAEGGAADRLQRVCPSFRVVVSSASWIDVMDPLVNKGVAVRALQSSLGVTSDETVVFGDYLNDLEMLDEAEHSFAMANAHPEVILRARHLAPANTEHGVVTTIAGMLQTIEPLIA